MFERTNGGECRYCLEKQPSCKIGQAFTGNVLQARHHLLIGDGATIKHHLPGNLAGAGCRAFLSHQQLRTDLRTGAVDFVLMISEDLRNSSTMTGISSGRSLPPVAA